MPKKICLICGSEPVQFKWTNLFSNGDSLIEVDLSNYCIRCGNIRIKTLEEIRKEKPDRFIFFMVPEEKTFIRHMVNK